MLVGLQMDGMQHPPRRGVNNLWCFEVLPAPPYRMRHDALCRIVMYPSLVEALHKIREVVGGMWEKIMVLERVCFVLIENL